MDTNVYNTPYDVVLACGSVAHYGTLHRAERRLGQSQVEYLCKKDARSHLGRLPKGSRIDLYWRRGD